jgi:hypothetical protein
MKTITYCVWKADHLGISTEDIADWLGVTVERVHELRQETDEAQRREWEASLRWMKDRTFYNEREKELVERLDVLFAKEDLQRVRFERAKSERDDTEA